MVVGDLSVLDDHMMGKHTAHSLMEATADGLLGYREIVPRLGATSTYLGKCLIDTMQRDSGRVGLEVGSCTVTLDSVAPLRNLPLKLHLRLRGRLRQANLDTVAGCLDIASQVDYAGQGRRPQASDGSTASIQGQVVAGALVKPAWRHRPAISPVEVAFLWLRESSSDSRDGVCRPGCQVGRDQQRFFRSASHRSRSGPAEYGCPG